MQLILGKILQPIPNHCVQYLNTIGAYRIYWTNEGNVNFFALDANFVICGLFEFIDHEDDTQLAHMNVLQQHQGNGIGKEIMRQAVEIYSFFKLPSKNKSDMYHFENDGLPFIRRCFDDGILTSPPFEHPDEEDFPFLDY